MEKSEAFLFGEIHVFFEAVKITRGCDASHSDAVVSVGIREDDGGEDDVAKDRKHRGDEGDFV